MDSSVDYKMPAFFFPPRDMKDSQRSVGGCRARDRQDRGNLRVRGFQHANGVEGP